jgi:hypothetical protein
MRSPRTLPQTFCGHSNLCTTHQGGMVFLGFWAQDRSPEVGPDRWARLGRRSRADHHPELCNTQSAP